MENKLFPAHSMIMIRDEYTTVGTLDHHVFLHLDTITEAAQIPQFEVVLMDDSSEPYAGQGLDDKFPGFYIHLPVYLATCLSYNELQILIHWCFLKSTEALGNPFSSLLNYYPQDQATATLIKMAALRSCWTEFQASEPCYSVEKGHPFVTFLGSYSLKNFLKVVGSEIENNKQVFRLIKNFDDPTLSNFLDSCAVIDSNQVFNIQNIMYYDFTKEIFEELRKAS